MNKYQRKKSKRIKFLVRFFNMHGCSVTYIQLKRRIRQFDRALKKVSAAAMRAAIPICKELRGLSANTYIIDETPIEATPAEWPKENPYFATRYLGKFHSKEDETCSSG